MNTLPQVQVQELSERDSRKVMREQFGQDDGFPDSEFDDSNMALLDEPDLNEIKPSRVARHIKRAWR